MEEDKPSAERGYYLHPDAFGQPQSKGIEVANGENPVCAAFDGSSAWVANQGSNAVSRPRAQDGHLIGTLKVEAPPQFVAFDGANI